MIETTIFEYYLEKNCDCGLTILHAANELWKMELDEKSIGILSGMNSVSINSNCRALSCAIALLGILLYELPEREMIFNDVVNTLIGLFEQRYGTTECLPIKFAHASGDRRCYPVLVHTMMFLYELVNTVKEQEGTEPVR